MDAVGMSNGEAEAELDLDFVRIDASIALRVPEALALRRRVLLFGREADRALAACADPNDQSAIEALERIAGTRVVAVRAEPASLDRALSRVFHRREESRGDEAIRTVDEVLHAALLEQASDIHFEPGQHALRVRFRVDGALEVHRSLPVAQMQGLVNRLKVLAGMDIAERRVPQDGRFRYSVGEAGRERSVDVRAAALPTKFGERITLRLLALQAESLTLSRLGMAPADLDTFAAAIGRDHGLVLLTGPTGSGKTTTLYAALRALDLEAHNVLTVEDPIEYDLPGVSQIEVDEGDRVSFGRALRSMLRHDPDILMIGEIRDLETADTAVKASLTGHLVLSTLHTNSAVSAVTRLADMGIPPYLIGATLRLSIAQRLVRRLCTRCRRERELSQTHALALGDGAIAGRVAFEPEGCAYCKHTGFVGRVGVFESFAPDAELCECIARGAQESELARLVHERGGLGLRDDARAKVLAGVTSAAESLRAVEVA